MQVIYIIIGLIISYLIGAVPYGFLVPKLFKNIDIRDHGSGNVGSTNVVRVLGAKYGVLVFLLDCFKGALPILIVRYFIAGTSLHPLLNYIDIYDIAIIYGVFAALGHIYSVFIKGKGGKAVATGVGAVIALNPILGLSGIALFFIVAYSTKYVSIGSVVASFGVGIGLWGYAIFENNVLVQIVNLTAISLMIVLIIIKHRKNFVRLYHGTENKIGQKKKRQQDSK